MHLLKLATLSREATQRRSLSRQHKQSQHNFYCPHANKNQNEFYVSYS